MAFYGVRRSRRRSSGGDSSGGTRNVMVAVVMMAITIVIALLMINIVADAFDTALADNTIAWDSFAGAEAMAGMFPLLMLIMDVVLGSALAYLTATGRTRPQSIMGVIMASVAAVVFAIFLPTIMDICEDLLTYTSLQGFTSVASTIPMFAILGAMGALGFLGYRMGRS